VAFTDSDHYSNLLCQELIATTESYIVLAPGSGTAKFYQFFIFLLTN